MTKPIMVIIDEAKWCAGSLSNEHGERCAMGYVAEHMGMTLRNSKDTLANTNAVLTLLFLFNASHSNWQRDVHRANDLLTGDARKLELTRLFREQGMVLCFVDSSKAKVVEEPVKACAWVTA